MMIKISDEKLKDIIDRHQHWLYRDCPDWENMYAVFSNLDLTDRFFSPEHLLQGASFINCDLNGADFTAASLTNATFFDTYLRHSFFEEAKHINGAYFYCTDIHGSTGIPYKAIPMACPDTGAFIAYKKAGEHVLPHIDENGVYILTPSTRYIVKLLIPEDAKRSSGTGRKCRCDKAVVLEIQNLDGSKADIDEIRSSRDKNFIYRVGQTVTVDDFDEFRFNECSTGIHFFIDRNEAVNYGCY